MSSIPQRKKTPEELAALRAQEFSQAPAPAADPTPPKEQDPDHQRFRPPEKHGVFHDAAGHAIESVATGISTALPEPAPQRPPRRGRPEKRGTVHAFDGLRPEAAMEVSHGSHGSHGTAAPLPVRKHDGSELQQLRHRGLMQTRPPVQSIVQMSLHPMLASILYIVAVTIIYLTVRYWSPEGTQRFYSPAAGCAFLLLVSLGLYWKKPRARHHAAFLCGIAVVILGFVILLTLKNPYAP